jgi:hypothetical protein
MKVGTREEIHRLVDQLDDINAEILLEYLQDLLSEEETLTEEEIAAVLEAEERMAKGEYITLEELQRELGLTGERDG